MTLNEFKAWFEGYTHDKTKLNKEDLDLVREKLSSCYENMNTYPHTQPSMPNPYRWYTTCGNTGMTLLNEKENVDL